MVAYGIQARADALDAIGSEILSRKEELGRLLAREEGKSLPESIGEAARAGHIFKYFGGETVRQVGDRLASVRPGVEIDITREPLGVIGIITPWNFPIAIPVVRRHWPLVTALSSNLQTLSWMRLGLAEIIHRHLPGGVFNLLWARAA